MQLTACDLRVCWRFSGSSSFPGCVSWISVKSPHHGDSWYDLRNLVRGEGDHPCFRLKVGESGVMWSAH